MLSYQKEKRKKYAEDAIYYNNIGILIINYIVQDIF